MEEITADILPGCCRSMWRNSTAVGLAAGGGHSSRHGAPELGADPRELNRTWADQQLPEKYPAEIWNLHGVAETCAGDGTIETIYQGTENTSVFLWLSGHPSKSIEYPLEAVPVGFRIFDYLASLLAACLLKNGKLNTRLGCAKQRGVQLGKSVATTQPEPVEMRTGE